MMLPLLLHRGLLRPLLSTWLAFVLLFSATTAYESVSDETLRSLPRPGKDFDIHDGALLAPILVPRVSGTAGSTAVLNHLADFIRTTLPDWTIQFQNSTSKTPVSKGKEIPFVNLIASRDPPGTSPGDVGRLTLVAHYDSKYEPQGFIGAIDSAAPCAIIMHTMRSIDSAMTKKWEDMRATGQLNQLEEQQGIQVIFMDGEEAFKEWTASDSLYGARSLAEQWDAEVHPAMSVYRSPLDSISLFVLLDLLGAKEPTIQSFFPTTHWAYKKLATLERRLRELKQLQSSDPGRSWFPHLAKSEHEIPLYMRIEDDHIPFLRRGVEVLHIIDAGDRGFPKVWHTMQDDGEHLDLDTVEDWSVLFTAFAAEWMELEGFMDASQIHKRSVTDAWHKTEFLQL
ncbi:glutaminyl-peptide cyclotransferase family protein [Aspergillus saccharolyticus JOP 1030-1]|uniref:Peptide hydrolase n=1 Tax=Aspergillus saccharolyticus JOP 1030-1 TaxID=1450539 RepID=A0A318ZKH9_9EURO|nr:glutaminyl cyclase [Aspergillus saccharolyticus JOP 1030-1]PYH47367.1 glutaminyl cyclase [Aspergillus saccharolyticus JOP 1030-1]